MAVAKKDTCVAIKSGLRKTTFTYPEGEEKLIVDPMVLSPESKDYLTQVTGNRISVEELITRFAFGLNQGDDRLL